MVVVEEGYRLLGGDRARRRLPREDALRRLDAIQQPVTHDIAA